jgi:Ser/Thr protein kinase RdoA (MazF antagonist)
VKPEIKSRFNDNLLREAMHRYGLEAHQARPVGEFDSFVYEINMAGQAGILRISHSSVRSAELVMGELDWLNYLVQGGASVCGPIPTASSELIQELDDQHGQTFIAAAFNQAEGVYPKSGEWNRSRTEQYGQMLGQIHRLSRTYRPSNKDWTRLAWNHPVMLDVERTLSSGDKAILDEFRQTLLAIEQLPKDEQSYGLIHQDAHGENIKIDDSGRIRLYDFFDCAYSWYVNDIAIVLFYAAMWEKDRAAFANLFMQYFLTGYCREFDLDEYWLQQIPIFLKLREIDLYSVILREFGTNWQDDAWNAGYMHRRKEKIEAGTPYIEYDFSELANLLN